MPGQVVQDLFPNIPKMSTAFPPNSAGKSVEIFGRRICPMAWAKPKVLQKLVPGEGLEAVARNFLVLPEISAAFPPYRPGRTQQNFGNQHTLN